MQELPAVGTAILLVTVVLAGAALGQTPIEDPDLPDPDLPYIHPPGITWSATLVYEIDEETGEIESYETYGGQLPEDRCSSGWRSGSSGLVTTSSEEERLLYRIDVPGNRIRAEWTRNGTVLITDLVCQGQQGDVAGQEPFWEIQRFEHPNGTTCAGAPDLGDRQVAPRSQGFEDQATAGDAGPLPCLEARAGGSLTTGDPVPFTGQVTATLTDEVGRTVVSETCTMIGGACWSGGGPWNQTADPGAAGSTWTLTCEADTMFGIRMPTAGDFGCEAWLPG